MTGLGGRIRPEYAPGDSIRSGLAVLEFYYSEAYISRLDPIQADIPTVLCLHLECLDTGDKQKPCFAAGRLFLEQYSALQVVEFLWIPREKKDL